MADDFGEDPYDEDYTGDEDTSTYWSDIVNAPSIPSGLSDLGYPDLAKYSDRLVAIAKNPRSFVIGALISALLAGILDIARVFVDAITLVLVGSGTGYEPWHDYWGFEDIPLILWDILSAPFGAVGGGLLDIIESFQATAESAAVELGLFAYPTAVAFIVITIIAAERAVSTVSQATISAIPVIGPALEVILYR